MGDASTAAERVAAARVADPTDPEPRVTQGLIELRSGNLDAARATLAALHTDHPQHFDGNLLASIVAARLGDVDSAIYMANLALRDSADFRFTVRLELLDAIDAPSRSAALVAHYHRALRLVDTAQGAVAVRVAQEAVEAGDHVADAHFTIGVVRYREGRPDLAIESLQAAVAANPEHAEAWRWLALVHAERGDLAREMEARRRALDATPTDSRYRADLARALILKVGDDARALQILDGLPPGRERNADVVGLRARALVGLGRYDEALPLLLRATELDPHDPQRFESLGWAYERMNRMEDALRAYEQAAHLAPGRSFAHLQVAYQLDDLDRPSEAAEAFERALALLPPTEVLRRRGEYCHLLLRALRLREARACAERNIRFNTFDPYMAYLLRVVPAEAEDANEARGGGAEMS